MRFHIPVLVFVAVCLADVQGKEGPDKTRYAVIARAWGKSTDVIIYEWRKKNRGIGFKDTTFYEKYTKSFASFVRIKDQKWKIKEEAEKILAWANATVPWEKYNKTAIYFFGSDAMRSLPQGQSEEIMSCVREVFNNTDESDPKHNPFNYYGPNQVQVLSGEEEAVFQWVTVNYLQKNLLGVSSGKTQEYKQPSALLNLGLQSLQVAYLPEEEPLAEEFDLTLLERKYALYAHTYQGFGVLGILEKITMEFTDGPETNGVIPKENPCFLKDDVRSIKLMEDKPPVTYIGTGDPVACKAVLKSRVELPENCSYRCNPKPCGILNIYQPSWYPDQDFYLSGCFDHILRDFGLTNSSFDIEHLKTFTHDYCKMSMEEANATTPAVPWDQLSLNCLTATYMEVLLGKEILGPIDDDKIHPWADVLTVRRYNKKGALKDSRDYHTDWRMGAFIVNHADRYINKFTFVRDIMPVDPPHLNSKKNSPPRQNDGDPEYP